MSPVRTLGEGWGEGLGSHEPTHLALVNKYLGQSLFGEQIFLVGSLGLTKHQGK